MNADRAAHSHVQRDQRAASVANLSYKHTAFEVGEGVEVEGGGWGTGDCHGFAEVGRHFASGVSAGSGHDVGLGVVVEVLHSNTDAAAILQVAGEVVGHGNGNIAAGVHE